MSYSRIQKLAWLQVNKLLIDEAQATQTHYLSTQKWNTACLNLFSSGPDSNSKEICKKFQIVLCNSFANKASCKWQHHGGVLARSGGKKIGYLCIQKILILTKFISTYIRPFMLPNVKCLKRLKVWGLYKFLVFNLILDINVMINWQLSKHGINRSLLYDCITHLKY